MPYPLICDGMEQVQIKNKNNRKEERSRGRMLELISRPNPKIGPNPMTHPDQGRPVRYDWWAPIASAIKEQEGAGGTVP